MISLLVSLVTPQMQLFRRAWVSTVIITDLLIGDKPNNFNGMPNCYDFTAGREENNHPNGY
jgi:hypothetical protein